MRQQLLGVSEVPLRPDGNGMIPNDCYAEASNPTVGGVVVHLPLSTSRGNRSRVLHSALHYFTAPTLASPLRIEYPSAVCHVTSRGDRRDPIAKEDADRSLFLEVVGQAAQRFDARVGAGAYLVRIDKMGNGGPGPIR